MGKQNWCVSKAVFLSKNRIWCNNTLPLFGLNMSFLCLKIHQHYSSIMQQIHYRLCTTNPWENSSNISANRQLYMERISCMSYPCLEDILNFWQQMAHSLTCAAQKRIWLRNIFTSMCWSYLFDVVILSQSSSMSWKMMVNHNHTSYVRVSKVLDYNVFRAWPT